MCFTIRLYYITKTCAVQNFQCKFLGEFSSNFLTSSFNGYGLMQVSIFNIIFETRYYKTSINDYEMIYNNINRITNETNII